MEKTLFIVLSNLFRLTALGSGFGCILLGYRLLKTAAVAGDQPTSSIAMEIGPGKIRMQRAVPGTVFAVFGMVITVFTLLQLAPVLKVTENGGTITTEIRGTEEAWAYLDSVQVLAESGDIQGAQQQYDKALTPTANVAFALAKNALQEGEYERGISYARFAILLRPQVGRYHKALAELFLAKGDSAMALVPLTMAARYSAFSEETEVRSRLSELGKALTK